MRNSGGRLVEAPVALAMGEKGKEEEGRSRPAAGRRSQITAADFNAKCTWVAPSENWKHTQAISGLKDVASRSLHTEWTSSRESATRS